MILENAISSMRTHTDLSGMSIVHLPTCVSRVLEFAGMCACHMLSMTCAEDRYHLREVTPLLQYMAPSFMSHLIHETY